MLAQAFDILLRSMGYSWEEDRGVIRVRASVTRTFEVDYIRSTRTAAPSGAGGQGNDSMMVQIAADQLAASVVEGGFVIEEVLNGLDDTYKSLGVPTGPTVRSIALLGEVVAELGGDDYLVVRLAPDAPEEVVVRSTLKGDHRSVTLRVLKPGGRLISISGPPTPEFARRQGMTWLMQQVMQQVMDLLEAGQPIRMPAA